MMFTILSRKTWALTLSLIAASCAPSTEGPQEQRQIKTAATQILEPAKVTDQFSAPGTIKARTRTTVSSKLVGATASVFVREGDRVHRGELLVEIEGRDVEAQCQRAEAGAAEARRAIEETETGIQAAEADLAAAEAGRDLALATRSRYDALRQRRSISPQEFDEVETRYKAAVANAERARAMLASSRARRSLALARLQQAKAELAAAQASAGYLKLTSPVDGIVTSRTVEPGMLASPGMPLLTIDDDGSYQLHALVEESRMAGVRIGQRAFVAIDAIETSVDATVAEIALPVDGDARVYTVKLDLALAPALRRSVRSGFFGRALFSAGEREALVVPESALVRRGQLSGVFVVRDGVGLFRLVKTGKAYSQGVEILSGLTERDRIISAPGTINFDGVRISESASGDAP